MDATPGSRAERPGLGGALLLLLLVAAVLYLPDLGGIDFHREEGRRVLPAREMLASGDFVRPTLWGELYLSKPPGVLWLQALAQLAAGGVNAVAARLVSVLATVATALALHALGRRTLGARPALFAALLFLVAPETVTKARLAEIEAPLALAVFGASAGWWLGRAGGWGWTALSGLALAAALLLKGPAALVFFLGPPVLVALAERRADALLSARLALPLLLGLTLAGLWALALFERVGRAEVLAAWTGQVAGQGGRGVGAYLEERGAYLAGSLLAFGPAAWLLLLSARSEAWTRLRRDARMAFPLGAAGAGWLTFLVFPGTSVRYVFPALPFVALVGGALYAGLEAAAAGDRYARRVGRLATALGALACLCGPAVPALGLGFGLFEVGALELALAALALAVGLLALRGAPARRRAFALIGVPLVVSLLLIHLDDAKLARHTRRPQAAAIDAALAPGEVLHVAYWANFNTLLYVRHEVRYAPEWRALPEGAELLVTEQQRAEVLSARPGSEVVLELEIFGRGVALLRLGPR